MIDRPHFAAALRKAYFTHQQTVFSPVNDLDDDGRCRRGPAIDAGQPDDACRVSPHIRHPDRLSDLFVPVQISGSSQEDAVVSSYPDRFGFGQDLGPRWWKAAGKHTYNDGKGGYPPGLRRLHSSQLPDAANVCNGWKADITLS